MVMTSEGMVAESRLPDEIAEEAVAAVSAHVIKTGGSSLSRLGLQGFNRLILTCVHGRLVFVNMGIGYLVVIANQGIDLRQILIEIDSAARRLKSPRV
jgi:predicted regulator of Ras-like GTPase activity (Roadblock/LC7/MglB family)